MKKQIEFSVLYSLCNKEQFFTSGDIKQYSKMFELAEQGITQNELAIILYICSVQEFNYIYNAIECLFE